MKEKRYIVDTTLRDGEQSPGIVISKEDKLSIAKMLDDMGVYEIEAGVPCLSAMEGEVIQEMVRQKKQSKISVWSRMNLEDVKESIKCRPDIIHIGAPVSYIQIYSKLRKNKVWVQNRLLQCVEEARSHNIQVTVGLEDSSRCDIGFILSLLRELSIAGVRTIRVADTVGVFTPLRVKEMVETIKAHSDMQVEIHAHNDLGMAVANSIVAARAGAEFIDCTLFGIGERAGNCNFYDFVYGSEGIFDFVMSKKEIRAVEKRVCQLNAIIKDLKL